MGNRLSKVIHKHDNYDFINSENLSDVVVLLTLSSSIEINMDEDKILQHAAGLLAIANDSSGQQDFGEYLRIIADNIINYKNIIRDRTKEDMKRIIKAIGFAALHSKSIYKNEPALGIHFQYQLEQYAMKFKNIIDKNEVAIRKQHVNTGVAVPILVYALDNTPSQNWFSESRIDITDDEWLNIGSALSRYYSTRNLVMQQWFKDIDTYDHKIKNTMFILINHGMAGFTLRHITQIWNKCYMRQDNSMNANVGITIIILKLIFYHEITLSNYTIDLRLSKKVWQEVNYCKRYNKDINESRICWLQRLRFEKSNLHEMEYYERIYYIYDYIEKVNEQANTIVIKVNFKESIKTDKLFSIIDGLYEICGLERITRNFTTDIVTEYKYDENYLYYLFKRNINESVRLVRGEKLVIKEIHLHCCLYENAVKIILGTEGDIQHLNISTNRNALLANITDEQHYKMDDAMTSMLHKALDRFDEQEYIIAGDNHNTYSKTK